MYLSKLALVSLLLATTFAVHAQENVSITEFMASNSRTLADENGEFSDWIEIFNGGTTPVNLGGWYLTDDSSDLTKWQFPATNLNAGAFLVVFASNKDRRIAGAPLHTNFRLSTGGEYLGLVRPDGTNVASEFAPTFPTQASDVSYGYGVLTTNLTLIDSNSPVRVQVPANGNDALNWTGTNYDDSAWLLGTNGVGFGSTKTDYASAVAPTAPIGFWRLNETSGTTAVNSGSGANLNGTYVSATVGTPGPRPPAFNGFETNNNAPTFNGTSGYVTVNSSIFSGSPAFTVAGWIKGAVTPGNRIGLFGQNDCVEFGFINPTTLECWTPGGGSLDAAYSLPLNTWHHVAAVGNGANIRIFVDGAQIGQGGISTASYGSSADTFKIGGGGIFDTLGVNGNYFNGQIDEVVAYKRALTTNEILALFQAGTNVAGVSAVPYVNTDIGVAMSNVNATAYLRLPFVINDPANIAFLTLRARYNDGFVAYMNGAEVVRVNAPATPAFNSQATNTHSPVQIDQFRIGAGLLQSGNNILAIQGLNVATADSSFLIAAELIQTSVSIASPSPVYMTAPTPGAPNAAGVAMPGPAFSNPTHSPKVPLDSQDVTVTVAVSQTFKPVASVSMFYRIMFAPDVEVQMLDDGLHGDGLAGDGIWGAIIPESLSTNGQMIRWSFRATDTDGNVSRWPLFANSTGPEYLGTIVDPTNSVTSTLPIFHLFVDPARQGAVDSQGGGPASLFHLDEFYDNISMQLRGNSTAGYLKKSHRLEFNKEHLLKFDGPGGRLQKTSFVADYPDPSYMRQGLSFWLCDQIGAPAPFYIPSRLQLNGTFYQLANHNDIHGEELLTRLGYDPNGALYNAAGTVEASRFSTGGFEKKTRKWDSDADYAQLATSIVETLPVGTRKTNLFELMDLPEVINYLVAARFVQENDDVWANMSLYHDNDGDRLWRIVPFDMNLSWGAYFYESVAPVGIAANNDDHKGFPLYGSSQALAVGSGNYNRIYDAIFTVPETREMFLRRMRTVLDIYVKPIGTPPGATDLETRAIALRDLMLPDATLDRAKWSWPALGGQGNMPPGTNITFGVSDLIEKFFYVRRTHFYGKHSVTNTALPIGISKTQNAGIPLPQPASSVIQISGFDFNPSSANQRQEYIQLTNPNPWAVELSGWKLDGAVQFAFKPGTVIPSSSAMYVSPDVVAFRARTSGPRGGQGLFVVGPYQGQLSARGEGVVLFDNYNRLIHTNGYVGNPSAAQQYLRITEIMYHPADTNEDLEYIELKNIGPSALNLTGVRFTNGVDFNFTGSAVNSLAAGARVLVVKNLAAFTARYGGGLPIAGQYSGNLENRGETIRLEDAVGEKILEFAYDNSWYPVTDGLGFSLVIVDDTAPWDTWGNKASWRTSGQLGGSPGVNEPSLPVPAPIVINEVLSRSDTPPPTDTIELYNPTANAVDLGGWFLTDDFNTPKKFRIPSGTSIAAHGYLTFSETQFNATPGVAPSFALSSDGDEVYLFSGDTTTNLTGYFHGFTFGAAEDGVTFGRHITSVGSEHFVRQTSRTLGNANAGPAIGPIVITEIMYHPADIANADNSTDEYIELYNSSGANVPLYDPAADTNTWQIKGGVDFIFPTNVSLNAGQFLLVVNFNPDLDTATATTFRSKYGLSPGVPLYGPYQGKLDNSGQNVELKKPTTPVAGQVPYVLMDKVEYTDAAPWPPGADGFGLSLHRKSPALYGNDPINWVAASPSPAASYNGAGVVPVITAASGNQSVMSGSTGSVGVNATGDGPLGYQWRFNGVNIPGANSATLSLPNFQVQNSGVYDVVVFNSFGSQVSPGARVDIFFPVSILGQPVSRTVRLTTVNTVVASNVSFTVFAASSGPITYQWLYNGTNVPGATNSTFTLSTISITNHGTLQAIATDAFLSVPSDIVNMNVVVLPTFTLSLPSALTVVQGDNVTYNVSITGFPPPFSYSWRKGLVVLSNITSSATSSSFTLFNVQTNDTAQYRVVVTNLANSTIATFNNLTVLADSDGDHIPDNWETQFGFNPRDGSDGLADSDNDGATNLQEYRSGTNPTNAQSAFKFTSIVVSNISFMRFQAVSNRTYSVQYNNDLNTLNWITFTNVASATTNRPAVIIRDALTSPVRFYRVGSP